MIDLGLLRSDPTRVFELLHKKDPLFNAEQLYKLDEHVRIIKQRVEELRAERNVLARKGAQGLTEVIREKSRVIGEEIVSLEKKLSDVESQFMNHYLQCPNIIFDDVPEGNKESNRVIKIYGEVPYFNFPIKNHVELGIALGWLDFVVAAEMTGSQFALYKGAAVRLLYGLAMFMLEHNRSYGYEMVLPPYLVASKSLEGAGIFPKFKDEVYAIQSENLFLIPTAEVSLTNMYRDTIFTQEQLPLRMQAWTSCFRREAGGYGAAERGLIRIHQFEKVEIYTICPPEESPTEQERMIACAESILQKLGLHYRISLLSAQDCSFHSAKTYDIEVWLPEQKMYKEVSSISNCTDFQARRCALRYRKHPYDKTSIVHTLNGSSLAVPRLMVALMEVYQQENGSIALPEVLRSFTVKVN
jgi:seryl-tRNA synthetase